jgi:hypothetical protein
MRENICYPTLEETQKLLDIDPATLRLVLRQKVSLSPEGFSFETDESLELPDRTRLNPAAILYAAYRLRKVNILELAAKLISYAVDNEASPEELDQLDDAIENYFKGQEAFHARPRNPITMAQMERAARGAK